LIAGSLVLATIGCGRPTPPEAADVAASDATAGAESPTPTATEATQVDIDDLVEYCPDPGAGYPMAATYDGNRHTIALFGNDVRVDVRTPRWHRMRVGDTISEWSSRDAAEIELLGCGEASQGSSPLGTCTYPRMRLGERVTEIPLYEQSYDFTVFELRTGRVVDRFSYAVEPEFPASPLLSTPVETCPRLEPVDGITANRVYPVSSRSDLEERLGHLLEGRAR
jgi:hypothetical protein